jgi:hypothetical protein
MIVNIHGLTFSSVALPGFVFAASARRNVS